MACVLRGMPCVGTGRSAQCSGALHDREAGFLMVWACCLLACNCKACENGSQAGVSGLFHPKRSISRLGRAGQGQGGRGQLRLNCATGFSLRVP
eukprot:scaffold3871_cov97-Isochrysis_galbana.AAC.10